MRTGLIRQMAEGMIRVGRSYRTEPNLRLPQRLWEKATVRFRRHNWYAFLSLATQAAPKAGLRFMVQSHLGTYTNEEKDE